MGMTAGSAKPDGSFTITNVAATQYKLQVYGIPDNYYVKSAQLGDKEVLDAGVDLTRGAAGPLEVVLSGNGGQIEGVILNAAGQPATGAIVVLVPDDQRRTRLYKEESIDQYGRFNIKNVAPGDYKLFAWEAVETGAYCDPEFLRPFESLGEALHIHEGSRASAQPKLIPAEEKKPAAK